MKTISIRIDEAIKARWDRLAGEHGLNQSQLMREAILDKLEELEDFYVVRTRTSQPFEPVSNDDVWKRLGLDN
jgi:RHH-type transcriptional regulator, rel operon repressor / antitoxin RelB